MKTLALFGLSVGAMLLSAGCATPGYSAAERNQMISRNWDYEGKMAVDDWDRLFLLNPASRLTPWNVE